MPPLKHLTEKNVDTTEMVRPVSTEKLDSIKSATSPDPLLSRVFDHTVNGWPKYAKDVPEQLRLYHSLRKHPFLLALRRWGRFSRSNVCASATEIPY